MKTIIIKVVVILFIFLMNGCSTSRPPLEHALNTIFPNKDIEELAHNINLPAQIALLAHSHNTLNSTSLNKDWLADIVERIDNKGELSKLDISKDSAKQKLKALLITRSCSTESHNKDEVQEKIIQLAVDEGLKNFAITPSQAHEVVGLVQSGQFYRDIGSSVISIAQILPKIANKLIINPPSLSHKFKDSYQAIKNDFKDNTLAIECIKQIRNKKSCESRPQVLKHTLKILYQSPTIDVTKETIGVLLEKDSIRLAIIIYAKSNGIDIEQEDITSVQNMLSNPDPELGNLFTLSINRMVEKYGVDDTWSKLTTMGTNASCDNPT